MSEQHNSNHVDKSKATNQAGHYRPIRRVNPAYIDKINKKSQPNRLTPKLSTAPSKTSLDVPVAQSPSSHRNTKYNKKTKVWPKILIGLNLFLIISLLTGLILLYLKYLESQTIVDKLSTVQGQQEFNKKELDAILADMQRLVELPKSEVPSMATVVDVSKVSNLEFYRNAQNGDRVIVYNVAKKRYLYRPSTNIIVNVESFESNPTAQ